MKKKLNVLYFHGLGGGYSEDNEKIILKNLAEGSAILYPTMDYTLMYNSGVNPIDVYSELKYVKDYIDVVIGNSMGGFVAFHVAKRLNKPCLLFNPALMETTMSYKMFGVGLEDVEDRGNYNHIVIGYRDVVVPSNKSLEYLKTKNILNSNVYVEDDEHNVSYRTYKKHLKEFFQSI